MVSKGQIHEKLRKIFRFVQNLIKLDNELGWEMILNNKFDQNLIKLDNDFFYSF